MKIQWIIHVGFVSYELPKFIWYLEQGFFVVNFFRISRVNNGDVL